MGLRLARRRGLETGQVSESQLTRLPARSEVQSKREFTVGSETPGPSSRGGVMVSPELRGRSRGSSWLGRCWPEGPWGSEGSSGLETPVQDGQRGGHVGACKVGGLADRRGRGDGNGPGRSREQTLRLGLQGGRPSQDRPGLLPGDAGRGSCLGERELSRPGPREPKRLPRSPSPGLLSQGCWY